MAGPIPSTSGARPEAAQFITEALSRAAELHGTRSGTASRHLTAAQLIDGVVDLASERWGLLAEQVLRQQGIATGDDVGAITFQLIADGVFAKQPEDRIEDFHATGTLGPLLEAACRRRLGLGQTP